MSTDYRERFRREHIPARHRGCGWSTSGTPASTTASSRTSAWRSTASATSLACFLNYEFLHLSYHLPPGHPIARWGVVRRLERLHRAHHDPRLMAHRNFNITYPICDALFGTLERR